MCYGIAHMDISGEDICSLSPSPPPIPYEMFVFHRHKDYKKRHDYPVATNWKNYLRKNADPYNNLSNISLVIG